MFKEEKRDFVFVLLIGSAVFTLLILLFQVMVVRDQSMIPSLRDGQIILISRFSYKTFPWRRSAAPKPPHRGDVLVFRSPVSRRPAVKRVALSSGDLVILKDNNLLLSRKTLPISRTGVRNLLEKTPRIPQGKIFVLGDNPPQSLDSRSYGFIDMKNLIGKVIWPPLAES